MLTREQVKKVKEHLEKAQNPVFFFDNDQDGLCSFLLLQRYIGRGKGVAIKSFPSMIPEYFRKVNELNADYIFILDKPLVSESFFDEARKVNIPIVWIDHHKIDWKSAVPEFVDYYNPLLNKKKSNEPVTALCYQISKKKEDMWLAMIGCISDDFVPSFYKDFEKKYPDMSIKSKNAFDLLYKSEIGKIARILSFGLKDRTTEVVNMIRFLIKAKTPYEILEENPKTQVLHKRFEYIESRYQRLLKKAITLGKKSNHVLFFKYGGDLSISSELSNRLSYLFPKKFVVVAYLKGIKTNISGRGEKIRSPFLKTIEGFEGATAGGHENAVGAQVKTEDIEKFSEKLKRNLD